ncbi:hypothetical protein F2S72_10350 [Pseudomonas syringae pv. actinidiae]|nr:hypothetical protein [Pseudomonas syringae pv. actinidiae]NVL50118.1 hypothetical protein [Pseudomonas syringae pv. actinidiae]
MTTAESIVFTTLRFKGGRKILKTVYGYHEEDFDLYVKLTLGSGMVSTIYEESCDFRVLPFSGHDFRPSGVRYACYTVMALGGVVGHFFYILQSSVSIFYPHDDTGFGVIALGEKNKSSLFF